MPEDKLAAFLAGRKGRTEDRPMDRLAAALRKSNQEKPTKLEHTTPDHIPDKPHGKLPTIQRRKPGPTFGPGM